MKKETSALLHVGPIADKATHAEFHRTMTLVLDSASGDAVKVAAIEALAKRYGVDNTTISNCVFNAGDPK